MSTGTSAIINPIDREALREQIRSAGPVANFCVDNFLDPGFAEAVAKAFPSYEEGVKIGREFRAVNEHKKIQIADSSKFAEPILQLHRALASPEFLETLSYLFDMRTSWPTSSSSAAGSTRPAPGGTSTSTSTSTTSPPASSTGGSTS